MNITSFYNNLPRLLMMCLKIYHFVSGPKFCKYNSQFEVLGMVGQLFHATDASAEVASATGLLDDIIDIIITRMD